MPPREHKDKAYYLTLFKIEGHETYRAHLAGNLEAFEVEWSKGAHPKVTEKVVKRVDRITGVIQDI